MTLGHGDSASSSEDDAPESVSLAQSKRNIKKSDDTLQRLHSAEKVKKKLRNQEKDRRLKEQAENSKRRRKEERDDGDASLQARMERAMQEAAEEMGDNGDSGEDEPDTEEDEEEFAGIDVDSDADSSDDLDAESEDDDEEMHFEEQSTSRTNPNHLPDHLFTSAFASTTTNAASKRKAKEDPATRSKPGKRVRSNTVPKDVLIGSRTIRTLASGGVTGASTLPSAKARKFLDRSLGLKGPSPKKRGWERRPVNLGVMRRDGPAASFVRNR